MRQIKRRLLFVFISTAAILLLAEGIVRLFGWGLLPAERVYTDPYDPNYRLLPGALNPYSEVHDLLNSSGFRGQDLAPQKQPGVYRIVSVGDSTTMGHGVAPEETYSAMLEKELRARGENVEVLNAGVPGTWIWPQVALIKEKLLPDYRPDLVILYTGPSFRLEHYLIHAARRGQIPLMPLRRGLARSHLYRLLRRWLRPPKFEDLLNQYDGGSYKPPPLEKIRPQVREDLVELRELCGRYGARQLVIPRMSSLEFRQGRARKLRGDQPEWVNLARSSNQAFVLFELLDELGMKPFDASVGFLDASYHEKLFADEAHFSVAGHAEMARLLADELCRRGWLPRACPQ